MLLDYLLLVKLHERASHIPQPLGYYTSGRRGLRILVLLLFMALVVLPNACS